MRSIGQQQFQREKIDVVTTATLRPEILELTFKSFNNNLLNKFKYKRLIINIDRIGGSEDNIDKIVKLSHKYFDEVIYCSPDNPSFSHAVKWIWSQVTSPIIFHLEDDWLLKKKVCIDNVYRYFDESKELASIAFNTTRNSKSLFNQSVSFRPSFIRKEFIDQALPLFDLYQDPEKQWNIHHEVNGELSCWSHRFYGDKMDGHHIIHMGPAWRNANSFSKWESDSNDVTWQASGEKKRLKTIVYLIKYKLKRLVWKWL